MQFLKIARSSITATRHPVSARPRSWSTAWTAGLEAAAGESGHSGVRRHHGVRGFICAFICNAIAAVTNPRAGLRVLPVTSRTSVYFGLRGRLNGRSRGVGAGGMPLCRHKDRGVYISDVLFFWRLPTPQLRFPCTGRGLIDCNASPIYPLVHTCMQDFSCA